MPAISKLAAQSSPLKFRLGRLLATPGVLAFAEARGIDVFKLVARHARGDDGDLTADDKMRNIEALVSGERIFSSYRCQPESLDKASAIDDASVERIWIITEGTTDTGADRAATTVLLPSEY